VRTEIVRDYLNAVPLAASPGRGARDPHGLRHWFGADPDRVLRFFTETEGDVDASRPRSGLSPGATLILAAQRPSQYLRRSDLDRRVDSYLELLAGRGCSRRSSRWAARAPLDLAVAEASLLSKVHAPVARRSSPCSKREI
jgi:membrane peptidoglycan carboxypeptidase